MRFRYFVLVGCVVASQALAAQKKPSAPPRPVTKTAPATDAKPSHQIPATGPLQEDDVVEIGRLKAKTADDKFSDDPSLAYLGREVIVTIPKGLLSIEYDKETHLLTVATYEFMDSIDLKSDTTTTEEVGQNGYGAKANFSKIRGNSYGFWMPGDIGRRRAAKYSTTLLGPDARLLGDAIRLRLYGVITKAVGIYAEKDSAFFKKTVLSDATINNPTDRFIESYYLSVSFNKAEWIDSRTGAVIAQGDPPQ